MVTYLVVEIKKKSILCAVDEMKIVIYECLAHFFLLLYNYRTLGWLFISKYLSHGKTSTTNTHTFRLNTPNVNRNSGHTSFVMEIVYLSMSLSLGSTENLTLLGHTYTRTWHPLDLTFNWFFQRWCDRILRSKKAESTWLNYVCLKYRNIGFFRQIRWNQ